MVKLAPTDAVVLATLIVASPTPAKAVLPSNKPHAAMHVVIIFFINLLIFIYLTVGKPEEISSGTRSVLRKSYY
jgi:hypothetical protein